MIIAIGIRIVEEGFYTISLTISLSLDEVLVNILIIFFFIKSYLFGILALNYIINYAKLGTYYWNLWSYDVRIGS